MSWQFMRLRSLAGAMLTLCALIGFGGAVAAQTPTLALTSSEVYPGQTGVPLSLTLSHVGSVEGIEIGLSTSVDTIVITDFLLEGSVLEGIDLEFAAIDLSLDGQELAIEWILDSTVPFTTFLPPGNDQLLGTLLVAIDEDHVTNSAATIDFVDSVGVTNRIFASNVELTPQTVAAQLTGISTNLFSFDTVPAAVGDTDHLVDVVVNNSTSCQGFSMAITYDPSILTLTSFGIEDTITELSEAEFVEEIINVVPGEAILGVLLDVVPPYDQQMIPASGLPLPFAKLRFDVSDTIEQDIATPIRFTDNIGTPPIENLLVIGGASILPEKVDTFLQIDGEAIFLRGDADRSLDLDLADVIQNVFYVTNQCPECPPITCQSALDANDDGRVDIADGVWLANYLFTGGPPPPPPFPNPGIDPTPDPLTCD